MKRDKKHTKTQASEPVSKKTFDGVIELLQPFQRYYGYSQLNYCCEYDYNSFYECQNGSDCCANDYCRCGVITDARVTQVRFDSFMDSLAKDRNLATLDIYILDRLVRICKLYDPNMWEVNVEAGYYGQEVSGCKTDFNPLINHLTAVNDLSDLDRVKYVLQAEYGYLTDFVKESTQFSFKTVKVNRMKLFNENHMRKISKDSIDIYKNYSLPKAIVRQTDSEFYVIDGYHRVVAAQHQNLQDIDVLLLA